jgi:hypothetical protein
MDLRLAIKPILTFRTSKGSQYWLDERGRCQRNKSYHPEHGVKDQGLKNPYENVIFINYIDAHHLEQGRTHRGKLRMIIRKGKVGILVLRSDHKLHFISGPFDLSYQPRLYFSPIEIEELKYSDSINGYYVKGKYHIGNKIVELQYLDPFEGMNPNSDLPWTDRNQHKFYYNQR